MLIAKLFAPMSAPGFAALGLGLVGVTKGAFNAIEVIAIVLGLIVVAVAGVFTIRSNVAKIWREQAEGEKARNLVLTAQMADQLVTHAQALAALRKEADLQSDLKERALSDLTAANQRTDQTPVLALLHEIATAVTTPVEVTGPNGEPVKVTEVHE